MSVAVPLVLHGTQGSPPATPYAFATARAISGGNPFPGGSDLYYRWDTITSGGTPEQWTLILVEIGNPSAAASTMTMTPIVTPGAGTGAQPFGVQWTKSGQFVGTVTEITIPDWLYSVTPVSNANTYPDEALGGPSYPILVLGRDDTGAPNGIEVAIDPGGIYRTYWFWRLLESSDATADIVAGANYFTLDFTAPPASPTDFWTGFVGSHEVP